MAQVIETLKFSVMVVNYVFLLDFLICFLLRMNETVHANRHRKSLISMLMTSYDETVQPT